MGKRAVCLEDTQSTLIFPARFKYIKALGNGICGIWDDQGRDKYFFRIQRTVTYVGICGDYSVGLGTQKPCAVT